MSKLKPLELIKTENGYKITQYVRQLELIPIAEPKLTLLQKFKRKYFDTNPIYNELTTLQKSVLHTIAPIWANILEHNLPGSMLVTDDAGNRYSLDSSDGRACLVGEVYGFGYGDNCYACFDYNIKFASLNKVDFRNSNYLGIKDNLKLFLNHYYQNHMDQYTKGEKCSL